ncbi:hypothetical protein AQUCO_07700020v1 [Aquilegia coerulea]|uniref:Disease resistance protein RGA3 n=1 Tax=Aquilegia coerulea TaxID=218851 RepID=A0A2G5C830_AQUCA|nr:hypothetical protein AQUCO_07700020v1 [Aquilegia coerulea]
MADAVLGLLLENLSSLIQTEFGLLHDVKEEVEKLSLTLLIVRAVIEDAETRQHTDKAIAGWLRRLKDKAYDAEDVLDEWLTEVRRSEFASTQVTESLASWFRFNQPVFRHKIAKKIKKIHADFDFIAGEIFKFDLIARVVQGGALLDPNRETSSLLVEPEQVYGRDEDKRKIVDMLISNVGCPNDVSVFSIVGVGGLGKTTLAQLVYNDGKLSNHFEVRIWVCVAEDLDVKRVLKLIIQSLGSKATELEALDALQSLLKTLLSGRRFLLVLDDVWNRDQDKWDKVKSSLACGAKGSSVLVTTRLDEVALIIGGLSTYHLTPLSEDECWYLFKGRAVGMGNDDLFPELVTIGREIVHKCKGIPLAAKVFRNHIVLQKRKDEGGAIIGVLRLSYNHLSPQHRQCFSYCSIYPKDYEMRKEELIQLWMANSFVQCVGRMELDDVGSQIFNDLLRGSFFQDPRKDYSGNVVKCKMHDLMHDLACSLTKTECCVVEAEKILSLKVCDTCPWNLLLRNHYQQIQMIFSKLKYLRASNLRHSGIEQVPDSIDSMKCLRLLPDSICTLINLQTLNLNGCRNLTALPKHMSKMRSLRHLDVGGCWKLSKMPIKMGQMVELHTLGKYVVGEKKGEQINELNGLKHLSGELDVLRLELVKDSTEAKEADLVSKPNLSSLLLSWGEFFGPRVYLQEEEEEKKKSERVLECLQPHVNLNQTLTIVWYQGVVLPGWISLLRNVREIQLSECSNCETLPALGQLPRLQVLRIRNMRSLKCIGAEFYGEVVGQLILFPSLEELQLESLTNLEKWEFPYDDENDSAFRIVSSWKHPLFSCQQVVV